MADRAHKRAPKPPAPDLEERAGGARRAPMDPVAMLQRQVGNRVVGQYLQRMAVQREKEGDGPTNDIGIMQQQLNAVGATPRVGITGRFDASTTAATKTFQRKLIAEGVKGVAEDGIIAGATLAQLKVRAPSVNVTGTDTVVRGPGNAQAAPWDPAAGVRGGPLAIGAKGVGVKELQERLNSSKKAGKDLTVDGRFGPRTEGALKTWQATVPLPATGVADPATWAKLETAGAATQGHVEFDWVEEVEGAIAGARASYDWKLTKTALKITVGINFVKRHTGVDGRINDWLTDIQQIWNTFKAVNHSDPKKKSMNIDFAAKRGPGHDVEVFKFDPRLAKADRGSSRSDAKKWYTIDRRRMLAPHEFGHLIGLADEYNRTAEHYVEVTGEEPGVGPVVGTDAEATTLATQIKAAMPLADVVPAPEPRNDRAFGALLAGVVSSKFSNNFGDHGGFAQLVAQKYAAANGGASLYLDIKAAFDAKNVTGFTPNKTVAVTPFLYSNRGLMGTGAAISGATGSKVPEHEHPVEPRHVQPFVNILSREWALQNGALDLWKPERR